MLDEKEIDQLTSDLLGAQEDRSFNKIKRVFREIYVPSLSVFGTFVVTIGVFPSIVVLIESEKQCDDPDRFYNDLFVPFLFLLFNLFDFLGRFSAGYFQLIFNDKNIWIPACCRLVFIPLFLFCNVSDSKLPVLFPNDAFPILFMIIMAFTNGYVASTAMMLGPSIVAHNEGPLAGNIMIFSLTLGLLGGACLSFLCLYISQGSV
jgi:equilibrative nucleoside transporter 1/2/3